MSDFAKLGEALFTAARQRLDTSRRRSLLLVLAVLLFHASAFTQYLSLKNELNGLSATQTLLDEQQSVAQSIDEVLGQLVDATTGRVKDLIAKTQGQITSDFLEMQEEIDDARVRSLQDSLGEMVGEASAGQQIQ